MIDFEAMADYSCRPCRLVWLGDETCPICRRPGSPTDKAPLEVANDLAGTGAVTRRDADDGPLGKRTRAAKLDDGGRP